jgi:cytochrome c553
MAENLRRKVAELYQEVVLGWSRRSEDRKEHEMTALIRLAMIGCVATSVGCTKPDAPVAGAPQGRRLGDIMSEVGRRFERVGRAAVAGRWELAGYDLGELDELFADIPTASMPEDVSIDVRPIARAFVETHPAELKKAIAAKDRAAFEAAFARAAGACNGCHQAAKLTFIEVPMKVGVAVPVIEVAPDPVP